MTPDWPKELAGYEPVDPLLDALREAMPITFTADLPEGRRRDLKKLREALAKRGYKIVKDET